VTVVAEPDVRAAVDLLAGRRVVALTGAGISTDSGIPDYRGPDSPPRRPMTYQEFVSGRVAQQRYWGRAHVGWNRMSRAVPNAGHDAMTRLERAGAVAGLITQNVDGLHALAGSPSVIDLHGRISDVVCLHCRRVTDRGDLHRRLEQLNPGQADRLAPFAPDGDSVLDDTADFRLCGCTECGGPLKPDVVFFGENVPKDRVARCIARVDAADALLVVGSSLQVMSGLRFVRQAARVGKPVVIVNRGPTRGDDLATHRVDGGCSPVLETLAHTLPLRSSETYARSSELYARSSEL
jgi:NAD-dependent SIR2 family protein deacetylase